MKSRKVSDKQGSGKPAFTPTQGRYLSFIQAYTAGFGLAPAEAEIAEALKVSPPSVHQMMKTLESKGLIQREAGVARSIRILVDAAMIPKWEGGPITRTVREWVRSRPPRAGIRRVVARRASQSSSGRAKIYRFRITLLNSKPPIWRRIETADCSLNVLHQHVQTAMGWSNSHLHEFLVGSERYTDARLMDDPVETVDASDSAGVRISDLVARHGQRFRMTYVYDFGDQWEHSIMLEKITEAETGQRYPRCVEGRRACPPEDVGGVGGFREFLNAIRDPDHEEHDDYLQWSGPFDAEEFDPERATRAMRKGLPAW